MKSVKVNLVTLLATIKQNKDNHDAAFVKTVEQYKEAVLKAVEHNLEIAKTGDLEKIANMKPMPPSPVTYTSSYEKMIKMLEMSVDTDIELSDSEFDQYVMDNWYWKPSFALVSGSINDYLN